MNKFVYFCSLLLLLAFLSLAWTRNTYLGTPYYPKTVSELSEIEVTLDLSSSRKTVKTKLYPPAVIRSRRIIKESFESRGLAAALETTADGRLFTWHGRATNDAKDKGLVYHAIVQTSAKSVNLPAKWFKKKLSLSSLFKEERIREIKGLIRSIKRKETTTYKRSKAFEKCIASGKCPGKDLFEKERRSGKLKAQTLTAVLKAANIPAVALRGIKAHQARRDTKFSYWVSAHDSKTQFDLLKKKDTPYLLWGPIVSYSKQVRPQKIRYSIVPLSARYQAGSRTLAKKHPKIYSILSLHAAPISAQAAFRLMLLIPIGTLVITILRILIGMPMFGTFIPILLALSFRDIGILWGTSLLALILSSGLLCRLLFQKMQLLFVPRVSATLIFVVIIMLAISRLTYEYQLDDGLSVVLFPMVILALLVERLSISISEAGMPKSLLLLLNTSIASLAVYWVIHPPLIRYWAFEFPEFSLACLAFVLLLGRYSGYRLFELFRFRSFAQDS